MRGKQIKTLEALGNAVSEKKAVVVPYSGPWHKPLPAAFLICLQGATLLRLFRIGMYVYQKQRRKVNDENRST